MKTFITLYFIATFSILNSQPITFQKWFEFGGTDYGYMVHQTSDGGFISAGTVQGSSVSYISLLKTDMYGTAQWRKLFSINGYESVQSIEKTSDGGYLIAGCTYLMIPPNYPSAYFLIKTDGAGNIQWNKAYDMGSLGMTYCSAYYPLSAEGPAGVKVREIIGGYVFLSEMYDVNSYRWFHLVKVDNSGNLLWSNLFDKGTKGTGVYDLDICGSNGEDGFILTGGLVDSISPAPSAILIKVDNNGLLQWSKKYSLNPMVYETGFSVKQTADNGYIVTGITYDQIGFMQSILLFKTDNSGILQWGKTFTKSNTYSWGNSVKQASDSGYVITGPITTDFINYYSDAFLLKTNSNGNLLWSKKYGNTLFNDDALYVDLTNDGGYVMNGFTDNFGSIYSNNYLIKTDSNGSTGCFEDDAELIESTPAMQMMPAGTFSSIALNVTSPALTNLSPFEIDSALCLATSVNEIDFENSIIVFPNPSSGKFNLKMEPFENLKIKNIEIYNVYGEKVYNNNHFQINSSSNFQIDISNQPKGIYFLKAISEKGIVYSRLVLQ